MRRFIRHICLHLTDGPRFRLSFRRGDEVWASSIELEYTSQGLHVWHCWFFPWHPFNRRAGK